MSLEGRLQHIFNKHYAHVTAASVHIAWLIVVLLALQYQHMDVWLGAILALLWLYYLIITLNRKKDYINASEFLSSHQYDITMLDDVNEYEIRTGRGTVEFPHNNERVKRTIHSFLLDGHLFGLVTVPLTFLATITWIKVGAYGLSVITFFTFIEATTVFFLRLSYRDVPSGKVRNCSLINCTKKTFWRLFLVLLIWFTWMFAVQSITLGLRDTIYPAPGKLFNINTGLFQSPQYVHIYCIGEGSPTVWFEHGWMGSSLDFYRVYSRVSNFTRVCTWDRPGYGWSESGTFPRNSEHAMVEETRAHEVAKDYIFEGGVRKPLVYVGHSMAGFHSRIYNHLNPGAIGSLVLCDSVSADSVGPDIGKGVVNGLYTTNLGMWNGNEGLLLGNGMLRFLYWFGIIVPPTVKLMPKEIQGKMYYNALQTRYIETAYQEYLYWGDNAQRCKDSGLLGDLPLKVLVADNSVAADGTGFFYPNLTAEIALLSNRSSVHHFTGADHFFVLNEEFTDPIVDLVRDSWESLKQSMD